MGRKKRLWKRDSERGKNNSLTGWQYEATQFNRKLAERKDMQYVRPHKRGDIEVEGYYRRKPQHD